MQYNQKRSLLIANVSIRVDTSNYSIVKLTWPIDLHFTSSFVMNSQESLFNSNGLLTVDLNRIKKKTSNESQYKGEGISLYKE